jgi:hypothetical protein
MNKDEKREAWRVRLEAFAASGLTQREWCAREGLGLHQLGYWRGRLSERSDATPQGAAWCALDVVPENNGGDGMTVRVGGAGIEVRRGFDAALLRDIVRALEAVPC